MSNIYDGKCTTINTVYEKNGIKVYGSLAKKNNYQMILTTKYPDGAIYKKWKTTKLRSNGNIELAEKMLLKQQLELRDAVQKALEENRIIPENIEEFIMYCVQRILAT